MAAAASRPQPVRAAVERLPCGVQLPSSPAAGPRHIQNGLARGFADTPLGALLAAVNIGVRANAQWGPDVFVPTIRDQVTGSDAPALLASCQSGYDQASQAAHMTGGQPLGDAYVTEEAFRWAAWSPADATVDLVSAGPGSQGATIRASTRVEVVWSGGDWRVVAPPGGDWDSAATRLTSSGSLHRLPRAGVSAGVVSCPDRPGLPGRPSRDQRAAAGAAIRHGQPATR